MDRTYHREVTLQGIVAAVLLGIAALTCFWQRTGAAAVVGAVLAVAALLAVERITRTSYVLSSDGHLRIYRGRLSRILIIPIADVTRVSCVPARFLRPACVVVEYGAGHAVSVCPPNVMAFMTDLMARVESIDRGEEDEE